MQCKCGYHFAVAPAIEDRPYDSFAVVHDSDYPNFIRREVNVVRAETEHDRVTAIARSAERVGSAWICPDCARLVFVMPGAKGEFTYRLEAEQDDMPNA